ncbi:hypothetical protein SODALDRAFT_326750 [Sodiomyces alkalinus F11]|uniref:DUF1524 domain-containing protein n=1 Tax=Sodiomyces alkalinus (strain CBS 110278 / VKM F-3762 / F11) TaxID=1314773 RepID=A0A3N2Q7I4_SODAK|nr:hypothetical protein SODALDRAFT_326750 [Sodiomyces alkalinus F11]ROT42595.1 hypothetical protein SODALDRAFT_326750 [Sodiomyces alkalinus F11]
MAGLRPASSVQRRSELTREQSEYVLRRDGDSVETGNDCYPTSGTWTSPFDPATHSVPSDVSIDHLVPLKNAWIAVKASYGLTVSSAEYSVLGGHAQLLLKGGQLGQIELAGSNFSLYRIVFWQGVIGRRQCHQRRKTFLHRFCLILYISASPGLHFRHGSTSQVPSCKESTAKSKEQSR